jgi:hypothetical protein
MWEFYLTNLLWLSSITLLICQRNVDKTKLNQRIVRIDEDLTRARADIIKIHGLVCQYSKKTITQQTELVKLDRQLDNVQKGVSLMTKTMESHASSGSGWGWR